MFDETFDKSDDTRLKTAEQYFRKAYHLQVDGHIEEAIHEYHKSIDTFPTAEAYTFLGWALSHLGQYNEAISSCESAISVDPDFGNPYNDIGAYLISLHQLEEAIPWLNKAKEAKRYEARHYPFFNLGRIFEMQGLWFEAQVEYEEALRIFPEYESAKESLQRLNLLLHRRN